MNFRDPSPLGAVSFACLQRMNIDIHPVREHLLDERHSLVPGNDPQVLWLSPGTFDGMRILLDLFAEGAAERWWRWCILAVGKCALFGVSSIRLSINWIRFRISNLRSLGRERSSLTGFRIVLVSLVFVNDTVIRDSSCFVSVNGSRAVPQCRPEEEVIESNSCGGIKIPNRSRKEDYLL